MREPINLTITTTVTQTLPLLVAETDGDILSADWCPQNAVDGAKTVKIRNQTQGVDYTALLTINGLAALSRTPFVMVNHPALKKGDVLVAVYTVNTAGSVAPGEASVSMTMIEPIGQGFGPGWAG